MQRTICDKCGMGINTEKTYYTSVCLRFVPKGASGSHTSKEMPDLCEECFKGLMSLFNGYVNYKS